ncbi:MarR family winged helix-turn-helix transcriptional regulator [Actinomycetospora chiangmaiensis]|uniref:MarR family winged helix-turn-helix transcriptional regulator n=1 Tax=Actinomycetospora chiangmaiensis TaxID=402650 RepID=UPI0004771AF3|nr:MarR family transcriptional regulator [Actinomycetospora chiangmaiensis]
MAGLAPEASLGFQVAHLRRLLGSELRRQLEPYTVAPAQFAALLELFRRDGLTQAELCVRLDIEQPTMANTLTRMQRDGLVARAPDPSDRRRSRILLTARARALEADLTHAARAGNTAALRGLDDEQVDEFMRVLGIMIDNLARQDHPPGPS